MNAVPFLPKGLGVDHSFQPSFFQKPGFLKRRIPGRMGKVHLEKGMICAVYFHTATCPGTFAPFFILSHPIVGSVQTSADFVCQPGPALFALGKIGKRRSASPPPLVMIHLKATTFGQFDWVLGNRIPYIFLLVVPFRG